MLAIPSLTGINGKVSLLLARSLKNDKKHEGKMNIGEGKRTSKMIAKNYKGEKENQNFKNGG